MNGKTLRVRELRLRLGGRKHRVLDGVDFELPPGGALGIRGSSGSGKSSLLKCLNGLIPWMVPGEISGCLELDGAPMEDLDPGQRAHLMGNCLDRPEAQLFLPTPGEELEIAGKLHDTGELIKEIGETLGLGSLMDRRVLELSSGERQRVALAAALAARRRPVLLDEPTAHLDARWLSAFRKSIPVHLREGGSMILTEQSGWRMGSEVDSWKELRDGRLRSSLQAEEPQLKRPQHAPGSREILSLRDLVGHVEGEILFLGGPNGAGKTTLARVISGHAKPFSGKVRTVGKPILMGPQSELQLLSSTVLDEVMACGVGVEEAGEILRRHRLQPLSARAPWTLSRGESRRVLHAAHEALRPDLMIMDEPAQGLDQEQIFFLGGLIRKWAERGCACLLLSHRTELIRLAHRHLRLEDGRLEEISDV